jgi:CHAD domain-containing protein
LTAGKWIEDLTAQTPLVEAARRTLEVRLRVVQEYLGLALRQAAEDPEYVHQLRVGVRRAVAALEVFADCLPRKVYRRARKRLRRLRRAAGAARDWDVFLLELQTRLGSRARAGLDFLFGYALGQRQAAQAQLQAACPDYPEACERLQARLLRAVRPPRKKCLPLLEWARPVLRRLLEELEQAVDQEGNDPAQLHQVRIAGKRLRYALEIFAGCFPPVFKEVYYPAIETLQEILGRANDSILARQRLEEVQEQLTARCPDLAQRYQAALQELHRVYGRRWQEERRRYQAWRRQWQQAGMAAALRELLESS